MPIDNNLIQWKEALETLTPRPLSVLDSRTDLPGEPLMEWDKDALELLFTQAEPTVPYVAFETKGFGTLLLSQQKSWRRSGALWGLISGVIVGTLILGVILILAGGSLSLSARTPEPSPVVPELIVDCGESLFLVYDMVDKRSCLRERGDDILCVGEEYREDLMEVCQSH
jgi:hypothetical protein